MVRRRRTGEWASTRSPPAVAVAATAIDGPRPITETSTPAPSALRNLGPTSPTCRSTAVALGTGIAPALTYRALGRAVRGRPGEPDGDAHPDDDLPRQARPRDEPRHQDERLQGQRAHPPAGQRAHDAADARAPHDHGQGNRRPVQLPDDVDEV